MRARNAIGRPDEIVHSVDPASARVPDVRARLIGVSARRVLTRTQGVLSCDVLSSKTSNSAHWICRSNSVGKSSRIVSRRLEWNASSQMANCLPASMPSSTPLQTIEGGYYNV